MKSIDKIKIVIIVLAVCIASVSLFWAASSLLKTEKDEPPVIEPEASSSLPEVKPEVIEDKTIRLMATGDNLIHDSIYRQAEKNARANGADGFDFTAVYEHIEPVIAMADIAYLNQETIIAEKLFPLSGYPMFNSPEAVGHHMAGMGFNVVGIANNHMFDKGEEGLIAALDFWESLDVQVFGAWRNEEAMNEPIITEKDGIKIAWVPITEHTNGLALRQDTQVRYILTDERELIKQQVELAKANADIVIVVPHWGSEYSTEANDNQIELAQLFADWGVDLVLGSHSHTLQPMEWRTGTGGNRTLVVYSLGNLVGSMLYPQNMLGGILDIDITKDGETGEVEISRAEMRPVVIHYEGYAENLRVYPFGDYTDELVKKHGIVQLAANYDVYIMPGLFSIDYMTGIIKKNIPEEFRENTPL